MKAAVLREFGKPLLVESVAPPVIGTGEVIVDVVSTNVLPYAAEVISNERAYLIEPPIVLGTGAIGRIRAVGPDATVLKVGDWVACDNTVRARDGALTPDIALQGWSGRGEGGLRLQRYYHDGPWAEQMRIPTEAAVPIGEISPQDAASWCLISLLLVPYGGLLAAGLRAGETVVVSGATGNFGSAAVAVALAMGAGRVVAPGRNDAMLVALEQRFGPRVRAVRLTGDEGTDQRSIRDAASTPIDVAFDIMPPGVDAGVVRTAAMTVREFGRIVLMGGVGMHDDAALSLPYRWIMRNGITVRGQWMYPAEANVGMVRLIRSGLIDLRNWHVTSFPLDQCNEAVAFAAKEAGPFRAVTIMP